MDLVTKYEGLQKRVTEINDKLSRLDERKRVAEEKIKGIAAELTKQGIDLKDLDSVIKNKEQELENMLIKLDTEVGEVEESYNKAIVLLNKDK